MTSFFCSYFTLILICLQVSTLCVVSDRKCSKLGNRDDHFGILQLLESQCKLSTSEKNIKASFKREFVVVISKSS